MNLLFRSHAISFVFDLQRFVEIRNKAILRRFIVEKGSLNRMREKLAAT